MTPALLAAPPRPRARTRWSRDLGAPCPAAPPARLNGADIAAADDLSGTAVLFDDGTRVTSMWDGTDWTGSAWSMVPAP